MVLSAPLVHSASSAKEAVADRKLASGGGNDNDNNNDNGCGDRSASAASKRDSPVDASLGSDGQLTPQHSSASSDSAAETGPRSSRPTPELLSEADTTTTGDDDDESDADTDDDDGHECWAVHTLERDMPDYDYNHLVDEVRQRLLAEHDRCPGLFAQADIDKCCRDDWNVARYLLRQKMNVDDAFDMIRRSLRFKNESLGNFIKPTDFPAEFYMVGGTFGYEPDRKGNGMMYIRVKYSRKIPEIVGAVQGFIMHNLNMLDIAVGGKGISVVFDCQGSGLANADVEMLLFVIGTLRDYFPKGLSYILVHELPWILKPIWHLAKTFIPDEYKQLIKFSDANTITNYVRRQNLPDFLGGTCKRSYKTPPDGCARLEEAAKLWGIERHVVLKVVRKFADCLPAETLERVERNFGQRNDVEPAPAKLDAGAAANNNNLPQDYSID